MILVSLLPIFAYFAAGLVLRVTAVAQPEHGTFLFRLVFFVTMPALAFVTIVDMSVSSLSILLPVAGFLVNAICIVAAMVLARARGYPRAAAGSMALGAGVMNMVFMFPFALVMLGDQGLADAILFDTGNALFNASIGYFVALRFGGNASVSILASLFKTVRSPLFIAVVLAVVLNLLDVHVHSAVDAILAPLGRATIPLLLIAVGIMFTLRSAWSTLAGYTVLLRMLLGLAVGVALVAAFGFDGPMAAVVVACAAAPIGITSVTLAAVGGTDTEQAVGALSISIAIGLVTAPLLLWVAAAWFGAGT